MLCNDSKAFEDFKKKLSEFKLPEIDYDEIEDAIWEAEQRLDFALQDLNAGIAGLIEEANTSLQQELASLNSKKTSKELQEAIAKMKEDFGDAVENLDELIDEVTNGINKAFTDFNEGFDSDLNAAQGKIAELFSGGGLEIDLSKICDMVPNVEKKPDGTVVEKPPEPVTPTVKPEPPEVAQPTKKEEVNVTNPERTRNFRKDSLAGEIARSSFTKGIEKIFEQVQLDYDIEWEIVNKKVEEGGAIGPYEEFLDVWYWAAVGFALSRYWQEIDPIHHYQDVIGTPLPEGYYFKYGNTKEPFSAQYFTVQSVSFKIHRFCKEWGFDKSKFNSFVNTYTDKVKENVLNEWNSQTAKYKIDTSNGIAKDYIYWWVYNSGAYGVSDWDKIYFSKTKKVG